MNLNLRMSFSMHLIMVQSPTLVENNWAKAKSVHRKKAVDALEREPTCHNFPAQQTDHLDLLQLW